MHFLAWVLVSLQGAAAMRAWVLVPLVPLLCALGSLGAGALLCAAVRLGAGAAAGRRCCVRLGTLAEHSRSIVLRNSLVGNARTLLSDTLVEHSCGAL